MGHETGGESYQIYFEALYNHLINKFVYNVTPFLHLHSYSKLPRSFLWGLHSCCSRGVYLTWIFILRHVFQPKFKFCWIYRICGIFPWSWEHMSSLSDAYSSFSVLIWVAMRIATFIEPAPTTRHPQPHIHTPLFQQATINMESDKKVF